jgi:hypothetical protein
MTTKEQWMSISQVTRILPYDYKTVRRFCDLPADDPDHLVTMNALGKDGRDLRYVSRDALDAWLDRHTK